MFSPLLRHNVARRILNFRGKNQRCSVFKYIIRFLLPPLGRSTLETIFFKRERLKSNAVIDLTPGIWNLHPTSEEEGELENWNLTFLLNQPFPP
ncbi:hypothetical protein J6590_066311 [Homalodisca vitripennis]|nr:hypothetical protein J6590_066311 [Homalodisca vitripennis]